MTEHKAPIDIGTVEGKPASALLGSTPLDSSPSGWRLITVVVASLVGLFVSFLDTTIVAVSLTAIANHYQEFDKATWVLNAYLLSYMAFAIVISRLSDPFGRKAITVASFVLFIAFSIGCALSQTMTQLIVFRALQGIGGSGLYSMSMVLSMTMIPPRRRSMIGAYIAICVVTAGVLGPILGGAITHSKESTTWPWIFWINLPIAGSALVAILVAWPSDKTQKRITKAALMSVDFLGGLLLLAASALLVFALQEAGAYAFAWSSATIIASLVLSGVCFVAFVCWQQWLTAHPRWPVKVVFPVHLMARRVVAAVIVVMMLSGFVYYIAVVNLPIRFQIASGDSPIMAGVKLLPMLVSSGMGSIIAGATSAKRNNTSYVLVTSCAFQILGYGLMTTLGSDSSVPDRQYGFQIFIGLGFGLSMASATHMLTLQLWKEPQWMAVTQGGLAQMRTLGGSIGLAISVAIFNSGIKESTELQQALTDEQISSLYRSPIVIEQFAPAQQQLVASLFAESFTQQMHVALYVASASFVISLLTWEKNAPPNITDERPTNPEEDGGGNRVDR